MRTHNVIIILFALTTASVYLFFNVLDFDTVVNNYIIENFGKEYIKKTSNYDLILKVLVQFLLIISRILLVSQCLSIGLFFYDTEDNTKFKHLFRIALLGEFVLVLVGYVKFLYFAFIKTEYTLQDIQEYYPLSYINLLDLTKIEPWLIYPLQTVNLFEVAYFFVLVYGLHKLLKNNYWKSFEITAASYGTGLLIWLGLVSFLTLSIT